MAKTETMREEIDLILKRIEQLEWKETLRYGRIKAKEKGITEDQLSNIIKYMMSLNMLMENKKKERI